MAGRSRGVWVNSASAEISASIQAGKVPAGNAGRTGTVASGTGGSGHPSAASESASACSLVHPCARMIAASTIGTPCSGWTPWISLSPVTARSRAWAGCLR